MAIVKNADMNKSIIRIALGTAIILLIPVIMMRFTDEVNWDVTDFIVMGSLLVCIGLIYELLIKKVKSTSRRIFFTAVLLIVLLFIWAQLSVGVFAMLFAGK